MRLPTPPVDLCKSVQSVGECFGCVGSTLLQNRQAEDVLPQISQILTDAACLEFCEFCVLWEYSSPTDCTDQHRWLVALVRPRNPQNSQKFGCVSGCVGTAGCHTLLHLCKSVLSVGDPSLQEASVRSVGSVGVPLLAWLVQQRLLHPLRLHQCHLWKSLLCKKFLCVLWVLWEAISRMWLRGYGRMPYPPILWGARCPVSSDRCRVRRCRSYPRYNR